MAVGPTMASGARSTVVLLFDRHVRHLAPHDARRGALQSEEPKTIAARRRRHRVGFEARDDGSRRPPEISAGGVARFIHQVDRVVTLDSCEEDERSGFSGLELNDASLRTAYGEPDVPQCFRSIVAQPDHNYRVGSKRPKHRKEKDQGQRDGPSQWEPSGSPKTCRHFASHKSPSFAALKQPIRHWPIPASGRSDASSRPKRSL